MYLFWCKYKKAIFKVIYQGLLSTYKFRIGTGRIELHEPVHVTLPGHSQVQDRDWKNRTT